MIPASLNIQLTKAKEAAEAASHAKAEFLDSFRREVHTAMHSIIGMTEAVLDTELNSEQHSDLSDVRDAATSLLTLIDDALDFFKIAER